MKDRVSTKILENGAIRYGVYGEDGTLLRYEYIRPEDEPAEEGTPLNKANLLSDETATRYGLSGDDATVNNALGRVFLARVDFAGATPNATVTATKGSMVVTATADASGTGTMNLPDFGVWEMSETGGRLGVVVIDAVKVYIFLFASENFGENSWDSILAVSEYDIALKNMTAAQMQAKYGWKVGDTKVDTWGGYSVTVRIADVNKHNLTTPVGGRTKGGILLEFMNCYPITFKMNATNTNVNSWKGCLARTGAADGTADAGAMATIRAAAPAALQGRVKFVDVITAKTYNGTENEITSDDFFLAAAHEKFPEFAGGIAGATTAYSNLTEWNALSGFANYVANANNAYRIQKQGDIGSPVRSWLRSLFYDNATSFCYVTVDGGDNRYGATASDVYGVAPLFYV